jgi:hypothetical protein
MGSDRDDKGFDFIDMVINLLREHEKTLDELIHRIEGALSGKAPAPATQRRSTTEPIGFSASLRKWTDFRQRCKKARIFGLVAGEKIFRVTAIAGGALYSYEEEIPSIEIRYRTEGDGVKISGIGAKAVGNILGALRGRLECGMEVEVRDIDLGKTDEDSIRRIFCVADPGTAKEWLASEMGVNPSLIIEGELQLHGGH